MASASIAVLPSKPAKLSTSAILLRALCIFATIELTYQIFDLLTNSRDTIYLVHSWYYTYSLIMTILSIPLVISIWKLKTWAFPILLTITAINQAIWFSFGVWDYRMLIFPVLFLLIWAWHFTRHINKLNAGRRPL